VRCTVWTAAFLTATLAAFSARGAEPTALDRVLREENAGRSLTAAPVVDDLGFLRRVSVDLIGRIPAEAEIQRYLAWPAAERRSRSVDALMKDQRFAARWTIFFADLLRLRSGVAGGGAAHAFVQKAVAEGMPYDEMCRQLIAASGKPDLTPEAGFVLSDDADPMVLAGVTSQVFLGIRIACAQCHNHPFDVWKREQFYGLAAFFGKTRKVQREKPRMIYTTEVADTTILWPPEEKAQGKPRKPVEPAFPFDMDRDEGAHVARFQKVKAERLAALENKGKKKPSGVDDLIDSADDKLRRRIGDGPDDLVEEARRAARDLKVKDERYQNSVLRGRLAELVTSPRNRAFSRNLVNRLWADLVGRGFVNPVDDFRQDNPPSHPKTLDYLADELVASGFDFRAVVKLIVTSEAYQRGHLPADASAAVRAEAEEAFVATPVRRMLSEVLYDSIVLAGHLTQVKFNAGENEKTIKVTMQEAIPIEDKDKPKKARTTAEGLKAAKMTAMLRKPVMTGYDLESSIDLAPDRGRQMNADLDLEAMRAMSQEELEARQMAEMKKEGMRYRYVTKVIEQKVDDNPHFDSAMKMASPAPPAHFLRIFGQPARDALGDHRDHSPSMRQALMMLNGKLTHEASRVGTLEPMHALVAGPRKDLSAAIRLAYREILTREPTTAEIADAKVVVTGAATPLDGMADLRWVLLNCHEFRFIP
jgi:hypothetical protein